MRVATIVRRVITSCPVIVNANRSGMVSMTVDMVPIAIDHMASVIMTMWDILMQVKMIAVSMQVLSN